MNNHERPAAILGGGWSFQGGLALVEWEFFLRRVGKKKKGEKNSGCGVGREKRGIKQGDH